MKALNLAVSLVTQDNDYQRAQAVAAQETAHRLGVNVEILFAGGDAIEQSQHLLKVIHASSAASPLDGIVVQPSGTGLRAVAQAATAKGVGWVVLHKHVDYVSELRMKYNVPIFMLTSEHEEEGAIQGKQMAALMPQKGIALCILGPSTDSIAEQRLTGMKKTMPSHIQLLTIRGNWTEQGGHNAISSWLGLSTSRQQTIGIIVSQNDLMAIGAKKAIADLPDVGLRERLLNTPIIGCDGVPESGQTWVRKGLLTATVVLPVIAGAGVEMLVNAIRTGKPPSESTIINATSYPAIEKLG
jgi:ribose transport system substrate-binding protein